VVSGFSFVPGLFSTSNTTLPPRRVTNVQAPQQRVVDVREEELPVRLRIFDKYGNFVEEPDETEKEKEERLYKEYLDNNP
jgi:hypothetical protein